MPRSSASNRTKFGCVMVESCMGGACRSRPKIRVVARGDLKHRGRKEASDLAIHHSPCTWPETLQRELGCRPDHAVQTQRVCYVFLIYPNCCNEEENVRTITLKSPFLLVSKFPVSSLAREFTCSRWHTSVSASWLWTFIKSWSGKLRMTSISSDMFFVPDWDLWVVKKFITRKTNENHIVR